MKLIGHEVLHKAFGKGKIIELEHDKITVEFKDGVKQLAYPDVFEDFMKVQDPLMEKVVQKALQSKFDDQKKIDDDNNEAWEEHISKKQIVPVKSKKKASKPKVVKPINRANIAFKCNMTDGERLDFSEGFKWIGCDENALISKWQAMTGSDKTADNKNKAMKLKRVQSNSLCVLTMRESNHKEEDRFIFGVFLVDETQEADRIEASFVRSESAYKMALTPDEARKIKFWKYHSNANKPETPSWSSGIHRYFLDDQAVQILKDIVAVKKGSDDAPLAERFLAHFIEVNGVDIDKVGEPSGALVAKN